MKESRPLFTFAPLTTLQVLELIDQGRTFALSDTRLKSIDSVAISRTNLPFLNYAIDKVEGSTYYVNMNSGSNGFKTVKTFSHLIEAVAEGRSNIATLEARKQVIFYNIMSYGLFKLRFSFSSLQTIAHIKCNLLRYFRSRTGMAAEDIEKSIFTVNAGDLIK